LAERVSPIHFQFLEPAFSACGYQVELLEEIFTQAVDLGLSVMRFHHNHGMLVEAQPASSRSGALGLPQPAFRAA